MTKHYNFFGGDRFGQIRGGCLVGSQYRDWGFVGHTSVGSLRYRDLGSGVAGGSTTLMVGNSGNETKLFGSLWKCGGKEIASFSAMYSLTNTG